MRKHSARKWLHFILDLLPVIILPVFALYEINHDQNTPIEVTAEENIVIDFNQLTQESADYETTISGVTIRCENNVFTISGTPTSNSYARGLFRFDTIQGHKYYIRPNIIGTTMSGSAWQYYVEGSITRYMINNIILTANSTGQAAVQFAFYAGGVNLNATFTHQVYDLTQMYGDGNEPSATDFDDYFTNYYYDYTLSEPMVINRGVVQYNDTDIGSQMMYALYKPVKNYFNFNNVFNFGDIYHWFEVSIFHGTAPMSFFIVWNIVLYQFVMDLVFLIYGLFMWFIDMCEKLMDKPLNSIK